MNVRIAAACGGVLGLAVVAPAADELLAKIPAVFEAAGAQYEGMLAAIKDDPGLPRTTAGGKRVMVGPKDWTSGFFPGALWYLHEATKAPRWREAADVYSRRLDSIRHYTGNHDVGFMLYCSYGNGWRLTKTPDYRDVLLDGAKALSTRFNPAVGAIKSWDNPKWKYPVIIDNMMNLELLTWASAESGDARFRDIAVRHADTTLANHFRPDASTWHVVGYDPETGKPAVKQTHQGAADDSAWARGQAWGLYGYTMMARETKTPAYLAQARRIAAFLMKHPRLPADAVPYWDFDAPGIPDAPRDASAAAIMASALIELGGLAGGDEGKTLLDFARRQLLSLVSPAYFAKTGENGNFLLMHCVGHLPGGKEIDVPLIYGDYYLLEALLRYRVAVR